MALPCLVITWTLWSVVLQARRADFSVSDDFLQLLRHGRDGMAVLRGQQVMTVLLLVLEAEDALHLPLDRECLGPDPFVTPVRSGFVLLAVVVLLGARLYEVDVFRLISSLFFRMAI